MKFEIYEKPGAHNTSVVIQNAYENLKLLNLDTLVVSSTTGTTILEVLNVFDPRLVNIVCVTHNYGFKKGVSQTFPEDLKKKLLEKGVKFVTGTLAFSGVGSSFLRKFQQFDTTTMFARLVRILFCDGVKVALEIALMAADAGYIPIGKEILTISGTGKGADTCCWIKASSTRLLEHLRMNAILAKPK